MSHPEPESSSSGIDVRSRESLSQSSTANSYSTATTPASLYETNEYYPLSPSDFPSPTSTDSMGGGRVLSNRATDSEIITSFARSSNHVALVQPPPRKPSKRIAEVVLFSVLILGVLSLFSIPAILHFHGLPGYFNTTLTQNVSHDSLFPEKMECNFFTNKKSTACTSSEFTEGNICRQQLSDWQHCSLGGWTGRDSSLWVNSSSNEEVNIDLFLVNMTENVLHNLSASLWCRHHAPQLLCQYFFPLCLNASLYQPTRGYCHYVLKMACFAEGQHYKSLSNLTAMCDKLPDRKFEEPRRKCSVGFDLKDEQYCYPVCETFNQRSKVEYLVFKVFLLVGCFTGMTAAVMIILSFIAQCRNTSEVFPTIFIIFAHIGHFAICVLITASVLTNGKLNCSDKNVVKSFVNPTAFCSVLGACTQYCLVGIIYWITLHTSFITYKVLFPIHSKENTKIQLYLSILLTIAGWLVPLPSVIVALTNKDFKYVLMQFPPLFCASANMDLWFYAVMIVINILLAIEVCLLLVVFWVVHKYQGVLMARKKVQLQLRISTAEKKLLFSFCYYVVVGIVAMVYFGFATAGAKDFIYAAFILFDCEAVGYLSDKDNNCQDQYNRLHKYSNNWLSTVTFLLLTFAPTVSLMFVFNIKKMKEKIAMCLYNDRERSSLARNFRSSATTSTYQTFPVGFT